MAKRKSLTLAARPRHAGVAHITGSRLRERDPRERRCALDSCGKAFRPARDWQKFCSTLCRYRAWDAENPRVRIKRAGRR